MELESKHGTVKIFAKTIDEGVVGQITQMANSLLGENAHIRVMSDCHQGKGCVIGTTMKITDKVCANLVGVDIGCGVNLIKTNIDFENNLEKLDDIIRKNIPFGMAHHNKENIFEPLKTLKCWNKLDKKTQDMAFRSLGTLGGGNHFLESYKNGYLSVHSGSRNIGWKVADYYQKLAVQTIKNKMTELTQTLLKNIEPQNRANWLQENKVKFAIQEDLAYLTDDNKKDYLHDIKIMQMFAEKNRETILQSIVNAFNGVIEQTITSTHNYIDTDTMILRKGAIRADKNDLLVIPLNMRDGMLICKGKGNEDWNCSAPHGAGRIYSRSQAKKDIKIEDYENSMKGIFSTCVNESTLDESPFAYKDYKEIMECIEPTVEILERIIPIYNFKASE